MALAKRGTRKVYVDGALYRWVLSPDSGFVVLVVERAHTPGQRLEAYSGPNWFEGPLKVVSPGTVADVIRYAKSKGWRPEERGPTPFRLERIDETFDFQRD